MGMGCHCKGPQEGFQTGGTVTQTVTGSTQEMKDKGLDTCPHAAVL